MALDAVGAVGGVLGLGLDGIEVFNGLTSALFPKDIVGTNRIRVYVGGRNVSMDHNPSLGGDAVRLAAWDIEGNFLGSEIPDTGLPGGAKTANAGFRDYGIEGRAGADYLSVVQNGNDGICIWLITGIMAGVGNQVAWTGDLGKACGAPWYPQTQVIKGLEKVYSPSCIWIDGNADGNHIWKGFNLHVSSFPGSQSLIESVAALQDLTKDAWNANRDLLCGSEPRFSLYEDIEIGMSLRYFSELPGSGADEADAKLILDQSNWRWTDRLVGGELPLSRNGKTPENPCPFDQDAPCVPEKGSWNQDLKPFEKATRRSLRTRFADDKKLHHITKRQAVHADNLVISNFAQHSAVELCESLTSLGPDMVSTIEGMFCDMSEKQLWPVCSDGSASYCFDMATESVRGRSSLPPAETPLYSNITTDGSVTGPGLMVAPKVAIAGSSTPAATSSITVPVKAYTNVATWDP